MAAPAAKPKTVTVNAAMMNKFAFFIVNLVDWGVMGSTVLGHTLKVGISTNPNATESNRERFNGLQVGICRPNAARFSDMNDNQTTTFTG